MSRHGTQCVGNFFPQIPSRNSSVSQIVLWSKFCSNPVATITATMCMWTQDSQENTVYMNQHTNMQVVLWVWVVQSNMNLIKSDIMFHLTCKAAVEKLRLLPVLALEANRQTVNTAEWVHLNDLLVAVTSQTTKLQISWNAQWQLASNLGWAEEFEFLVNFQKVHIVYLFIWKVTVSSMFS